MAYRSQHSRPFNLEWAAAWVGLVAIVAIGFFIQARTISELHDEQARTTALIAGLEQRDMRNVALLCDVTFALHPDDLRVAQLVFDKYGIECPKQGG